MNFFVSGKEIVSWDIFLFIQLNIYILKFVPAYILPLPILENYGNKDTKLEKQTLLMREFLNRNILCISSEKRILLKGISQREEQGIGRGFYRQEQSLADQRGRREREVQGTHVTLVYKPFQSQLKKHAKGRKCSMLLVFPMLNHSLERNYAYLCL